MCLGLIRSTGVLFCTSFVNVNFSVTFSSAHCFHLSFSPYEFGARVEEKAEKLDGYMRVWRQQTNLRSSKTEVMP